MRPFLAVVAALVWKDLLAETRSKEVLAAGLTFALLILVIFNFAFDLRADNAREIGAGILWVAFTFAGVLGIGRSFAAERDRGTLEGLLLAPIDRTAIYLAKTVTNVVLMAAVELVTLPAFLVLFNARVSWSDMLAVVALGTIGFAGVGTLVSAMVAHAAAREVMLPILLFPLEVPVVIASVEATAVALGVPAEDPRPWLQLLVGFDVVLVAAAFLVFEYVVEE